MCCRSEVRRAYRTCRFLTAAVVLAASLATSASVRAEPIAQLADFAGVRDNVLVGYGLVVGLDGTGDQTTQTPYTGQALTNMLSQMGVAVPPGTNMQVKNVAAAMITATLPPFARRGQHLDIVVSSVGNAKSLRGGTLLMTPLKGADGQVYALAQGNVLVGGAAAARGGSSARVNQTATGRIARGALVERAVPLDLAREGGRLELTLREPDPALAARIAREINRDFGAPVATPLDGGLVALEGPLEAGDRVSFMARVNALEIATFDPAPKVILNARTGAVVLNGAVRLREAAIAHGDLSVRIDTEPLVSQPAPFSLGQTVVAEKSRIDIDKGGRGIALVDDGADLAEVVKGLNALGATPHDLMTILEALEAAGSLRAELEII